MCQKTPLKNRNYSIDIFRILFAVYVVALHTFPSELEVLPFLSLTIKSFFRFSVPFFLIVSGYFFFKDPKITAPALGKALKKIIITYLFWSCLYFIINFITWGYSSPRGFIVDCFYSFFFCGSYYHLWYFPALIFSICVSALFCRLGLKKALLFISIATIPLCYLITEYNLVSFIPNIFAGLLPKIISDGIQMIQALSYFCCGQLMIIAHQKCVSSPKTIHLTYFLPVSVFLWFILIWCNYFFSLYAEFFISVGVHLNVSLIVLVLLLHPLQKHSVLANKCRYLANFTYYAHPLFAFLLKMVNDKWFSFSDFWFFPFIATITIGVGVLLYHINNKWINRIIC